jgi:hypothetical protein
MRYAKTLMLIMLVAVLSLGLFYTIGCGDYTTPEGASEIEKTGFYISTTEQTTYWGDSYFDIEATEIDEEGNYVYKYEEWSGEDKTIAGEFKFIFTPNPALSSLEVPRYVIVDQCEFDMPFWGIDGDKSDCGPWKLELTEGSNTELVISETLWSLGFLQQYISSMGGHNGDTFGYGATLTIWAKGIDGTEQEAETYNYVSVSASQEGTAEWYFPSWLHWLLPECQNYIDDDGDMLIDNMDPQCPGTEAPYDTFQCNNGADDDLDGFIDYPFDDGCDSPMDNNEAGQCNDGLDNDGDGAIDLADFSCMGDPNNNDEASPVPECDDGSDNDADTFTDFPADPECANNQDNDEST